MSDFMIKCSCNRSIRQKPCLLTDFEIFLKLLCVPTLSFIYNDSLVFFENCI